MLQNKFYKRSSGDSSKKQVFQVSQKSFLHELEDVRRYQCLTDSLPRSNFHN